MLKTYKSSKLVLFLCALIACIHGNEDLLNTTTTKTIEVGTLNDTSSTSSEATSPTGLLNINDGLPDATAFVGRMFEYSFSENRIFGNSSFGIKVGEAIGTELPEWLLYNSNRRKLVGIPSAADVGDVYVSVETVCQNSAPCFKDVFLLTVRNSKYGFKPSDPSTGTSVKTETNNGQHGCENEVVITNIVFCVFPDTLKPYDKVKLLSDMAEFLSLPINKLMLVPTHGQKLRALEDGFQIVSAGPGNDSLCDNDRNMELSWEIACSTLKHLNDFVAILQHNIEGGRIQQESGLGVVGWYIASSNSITTTSHKRKRRRAWRTPVPTPVPVPSTPTQVYTTSTVLSDTTSFDPSLTHTVYKPGILPTIQIAIRSTESSSYVSERSSESGTRESIKTYYTSTKELQFTKDSSASIASEDHPSSSVVSHSRYQRPTVPDFTMIQSQDEIEPTEVKSNVPSSKYVPYKSKKQPDQSPSEEQSSPRVIHSSKKITPSSSSYIISSSSSYVDPEISGHSGFSGDSSVPSMIPYITTGRPTVSPDIYLYSSTGDLYPSTTGTTTIQTGSGELYTRTKPLTDVPSSRYSSTVQSGEGVVQQSTDSSSEYEGSSVEEGSASDSFEGSASSGDKIDEEGSAQGSGDNTVFTTDDEDELKKKIVEKLSSSLTEDMMSSSLTYVLHPDEGGIVFENQPTDLYPAIPTSSDRISPSEIFDETMSSVVVDFPNIIPLFPDYNDRITERTTQKTSPVSGTAEIIIEDRTFPPNQGHGESDDSTSNQETTSWSDRESTTTGTQSNVIIEDFDSGSSFSYGSTSTRKDLTTPKSVVATDRISTTEKYSTPHVIDLDQEQSTGSGIILGEGSSGPATEVYPKYVTGSTSQLTVDQTLRTVTEMSTPFSRVTNRQNNKGKKNKNKNKKKKKKKKKKNKTTAAPFWSWTTLPPNMNTMSTKWPTQGLIPARNHKPYLENSIDYIEARQGEYFEYQIPRNVFYDIEDGDTQSLELSVMLPYNQPLPRNFWIQFDSQRQVIKGLPLAVDLDTGYQNLNLVAMDKGGLTETDSIKVFVNSSSFDKVTHKFIMTFDVDFANFMNGRHKLINLLKLIASYFGDSNANDITVMDISVGSLILSWTNNTLNGDECKNSSVTKLYHRMIRKDGAIRPSMNRHFGRSLQIVGLDYQPYGPCAQSTTTRSYTTFKPEQAEDQGLSIWAQVVLPVMVSLLVLLLIILLVLLINRRRKKKPEPTAWDKPVFNNDRNPIIFPDELEREEQNLKPKKPNAGASDVSGSLSSRGSRNSRPFYYFEDDPESNNSTLNSERSRTGSNKRPPKAPPPYWQPHSEPPPYRLPPPYAPHQTNV